MAVFTTDGEVYFQPGPNDSNEADHTSNMLSASDGIAAAFCGGGIGAGDHPYGMTYSPESDAATLEMSNDLGTFTWGR